MISAAILDVDGTLVDTNYQHMELIGEVEPLAGARQLILDLKERCAGVVLASSAKQDEVDHYLDLLDAREVVDDWTTPGSRRSRCSPAASRRRSCATPVRSLSTTPWRSCETRSTSG